MKNKLKSKLVYRGGLFTVVFCLILFNSCCKCDDPTDPECDNYDPCFEIDAPQAAFGAGYIYESAGHADFNFFYPDTIVYLDGDTIPATCTFYSYNMDVDSFYWKVGDDPRTFRGKSFYLEFGEEFDLIPINVSLIILQKGACFENGFVRDTFSKILVPSTGYLTSPSFPYFNNAYYGVSSEFPNDSFEINFRDDIGWIENMPRGTNGNTALYRRDYDEVHFTGQSDSTIWLANAKFQPDNRRKVVIRYKVSYDLGETAKWYTYEGYRIE